MISFTNPRFILESQHFSYSLRIRQLIKRNNYILGLHLSIRKIQVIHLDPLKVDRIFFQCKEDIDAREDDPDYKVVVRKFDVTGIKQLWKESASGFDVVSLEKWVSRCVRLCLK